MFFYKKYLKLAPIKKFFLPLVNLFFGLMSTIISRKQEVVESLNSLPDWDDKYLLLIDWGRQVPSLQSSQKTEANRVRGCTSRVWLAGKQDGQNNLILSGESDSQIVKGLLGILVRLYSGLKPQEILADEADLVQELNFEHNLMPVRLAGFEAMHQKIKQLARSQL